MVKSLGKYVPNNLSKVKVPIQLVDRSDQCIRVDMENIGTYCYIFCNANTMISFSDIHNMFGCDII